MFMDEATKDLKLYAVIRDNFSKGLPEFKALVTEKLPLTIT